MPDLLYERFPKGHYALFTMNRPDRLNAQGAAMREELRMAMDEFANDDEMRAGIVTGAGRAFSAGVWSATAPLSIARRNSSSEAYRPDFHGASSVSHE